MVCKLGKKRGALDHELGRRLLAAYRLRVHESLGFASFAPAAGQLGGWPMTWAEEHVCDGIDDVLMVRTYRHREPWLEVFRSGTAYLSRSRIT